MVSDKSSKKKKWAKKNLSVLHVLVRWDFPKGHHRRAPVPVWLLLRAHAQRARTVTYIESGHGALLLTAMTHRNPGAVP